MNPQRWQKIDELFQQAYSLPPQARQAFLNQACLGDDDLRREIESLLAKQSEAGDFFGKTGAHQADTIPLDDVQTTKVSPADLTVAGEPVQDRAETRSNLLYL